MKLRLAFFTNKYGISFESLKITNYNITSFQLLYKIRILSLLDRFNPLAHHSVLIHSFSPIIRYIRYLQFWFASFSYTDVRFKWSLMAAKLSSLMTCSIRQASSEAVSLLTPKDSSHWDRILWRS